MEPADLDYRLTRALGRLPGPPAPPTLAPRVMRAVRVRVHAPWYRRAWRDWPVAVQGLSLAAGVVMTVLVVRQGPSPAMVAWLTGRTLEPAEAVTNQVQPTVAALQILWRVVLEPLVPGLFGVVLLMCAACAVIGVTLNYVILGRTWQR